MKVMGRSGDRASQSASVGLGREWFIRRSMGNGFVGSVWGHWPKANQNVLAGFRWTASVGVELSFSWFTPKAER